LQKQFSIELIIAKYALFVKYGRHDSPEQLEPLNTLYAQLHLYVNSFQPVMKLEEKVRTGSKVKRVYDDPRILHARLLANHLVSDESKVEL
jgi:hypothetical protein